MFGCSVTEGLKVIYDNFKDYIKKSDKTLRNRRKFDAGIEISGVDPKHPIITVQDGNMRYQFHKGEEANFLTAIGDIIFTDEKIRKDTIQRRLKLKKNLKAQKKQYSMMEDYLNRMFKPVKSPAGASYKLFRYDLKGTDFYVNIFLHDDATWEVRMSDKMDWKPYASGSGYRSLVGYCVDLLRGAAMTVSTNTPATKAITRCRIFWAAHAPWSGKGARRR